MNGITGPTIVMPMVFRNAITIRKSRALRLGVGFVPPESSVCVVGTSDTLMKMFSSRIVLYHCPYCTCREDEPASSVRMICRMISFPPFKLPGDCAGLNAVVDVQLAIDALHLCAYCVD